MALGSGKKQLNNAPRLVFGCASSCTSKYTCINTAQLKFVSTLSPYTNPAMLQNNVGVLGVV